MRYLQIIAIMAVVSFVCMALVVLADTPGFTVGSAHEAGRILGAGLVPFALASLVAVFRYWIGRRTPAVARFMTSVVWGAAVAAIVSVLMSTGAWQ